MIVMNTLCGLIVPVTWFPDWLLAIVSATPFPSMFQAPIEVAMGTSGAATLAVQMLWVLILGAAAQLVLRQGLAKVVIQGG